MVPVHLTCFCSDTNLAVFQEAAELLFHGFRRAGAKVVWAPRSTRHDAINVVFASGADTPTSSALLPDTHVAVLRAERIVSGMEEAFALVRKEHATMPRALNLISGPSRTGDIEQTIVLGAHGPYRVHILVV